MRGRVLDIGAGAGRHSLEAQKRGLDAVAIDISPGAVEVCRLRHIRNAKLLSLDELAPSLGIFDTVLMMCGNLGLGGSAAGTRSLLTQLHRMTSEQGLVVFDSVDPHVNLDEDDAPYQARSPERGRMAGEVTIRIRYKELATPWFDLLSVSPAELRALLPETGWRLTQVLFCDPPDWYGVLEKA